MTPDEKDASQNHFVSMNIRNNNGALELEYLDSNGELMHDKERRAITKQLPGVSIFYRDHNGNRITESAAKSNQEQILRVQFDGHNCGMYSTEITNLMKHANGNEGLIKDGLKNISKLDPNDVRNEHYERLKYVYDQRTNNPQFISNFDPIRAIQDSDALTSDINDKEIEDRERKQMSLLLRQKINTLSEDHPRMLKDAGPSLSAKQNTLSQNSEFSR
ncbi:MAG: hypothetical protein MK137_05955 [Rickettsiales bacterium]|nr:hypothetical protein [Rickettsiales bacterium]